MMTNTVKLLPIVMSCVPVALLSACGGGGGTPNPGSVTSYQVSATAGTGGTISPANATVNAGGTTTLTVTANSGYVVSSVTGCGGTLSGTTYTTGAINAACTVTASFLAQYTVTATAGTGGTISPASATVNAGGTTTFTVTPKTGYVLSGFTGCGGGSLAGMTYTTGTINAACTLTASFAAAFTWVSGSSTPDATGVFGIQGVAAATNMPGARDGALTWTDASGNLWVFGGFSGYAGALDPADGNFMNDLWKYSLSTSQWTWVGGPKTACSAEVTGTQGVGAVTNLPGARVSGARWTDASGNLWLLGGGGCDSTGAFLFYNDLWKFSSSSGEWTSYANPVSQVVTPPTNIPVTWTDANGNLWRVALSGGGTAVRIDLWVYSTATHEWVWASSSNTGTSVYGVQGVAALANVPGARRGPVSWNDAQGNFWLFGGYGYDSTGVQQGELNDLWEYSPVTGEWTWVGGSNTVNPTGVYGTQGVAAATNVPPPRDSAAGWTDASGNFWVFGGEVFDLATHVYHRVNDLWKYSPTSAQWTWVAGSNTVDAPGVYGTQGVAAATNVPGARASISTWKDANGNVWLFGGDQFPSGGYQISDTTDVRVEMNDLWMFPAQ